MRLSIKQLEQELIAIAKNPKLLPDKMEDLCENLDAPELEIKAGVALSILDVGYENLDQLTFIVENLYSKHRGLSHNCLNALYNICKKKGRLQAFSNAEQAHVVTALSELQKKEDRRYRFFVEISDSFKVSQQGEPRLDETKDKNS